MTYRKVVELEILYQTMDNRAPSRQVIILKTRLERRYVKKIGQIRLVQYETLEDFVAGNSE